MTPIDFNYLREVFKDRSGLVLTEEKAYLVESRLMPLAREHGFESIAALAQAMRASDGEALCRKATEAMTVNETFFFRDKVPFDHFKDVMIPALREARGAGARIRIWCAAASTGQEPYSLAIQTREMAQELDGLTVEIVGTDICGEVLDKAKAGHYSQFEVQRGLPIQMLVKYFNQTGSLWQIDPGIRRMVVYKQFNLLDDFSSLGRFDVVFCRNVLIYFDPPTKRDILARIAAQMPEDGFLVLGAAETVIGLTETFVPMKDARGLYRIERAGTHMPASASVAAPDRMRPVAGAG